MATEKPKTAAPKPTIERLDPKTDGASANILEENVVKDIEDSLQGERTLFFPNLPAEQLRRLESDFVLFRPTIPLVGQNASLQAPPQLVRAALDEARRQADAMKRRKSELRAEAVLARLDREIENVMRRLEKW